ncbi:hypothetical protein [Thioclava sp. GXIMD4215]|uniref:hypothetical protein n=1 Tax=Thioclava sp. GXIMD4215 TaxID=3131928 RepID=UPI0032532850
MAGATLSVSVIEKRMMNQTEAADYCGLVVKHFKSHCPVAPIRLDMRRELFDKRDLDQWIDTVKQGAIAASHDDIIGRLA